MTPGNLQAAQPTWCDGCFSQQGVLISVESSLTAMALLTHVQLVTHHSSRYFFASLLHKSKWLFYICLQWITSIFLQDYLCDVFTAQPSFTSSAGLIRTLPSVSSKSLWKQKYWSELVPAQTFSKPCSVHYPIHFWKKTPISNLSSLLWPLSSQVCIQPPSKTLIHSKILMSRSVKIASPLSPMDINLV